MVRRAICILLLFGVVECSAVGSNAEPDTSSYTITPVGTFFGQSADTLVLFEGVDVFQEFGQAISDGFYSFLFSMVTTPIIQSAVAQLPAHLAAGPLGWGLILAWKLRNPVRKWRSYIQGAQGLWGYRSQRVGRMPVYFSSAELSRLLLVSWRYPLGVERRPQLEIIRLPDSNVAEEMNGRVPKALQSPTEKAFLTLAKVMGREGLVRIVINVEEHNLVLSVQEADGHWAQREGVRPSSELLAEQFHSWEGRQKVQEAYSLLTPEAIDYFIRALYCQDDAQGAWSQKSVKIAETGQVSHFLVARTGVMCDVLEVADRSVRFDGLGGYIHLNTGQDCEHTARSLSEYDDGQFENVLIKRSPVQVIPYWMNRLAARATVEGVIGTTGTAVRRVWSMPSEGISLNKWCTHGLFGLSMGKPELDSVVPQTDKKICHWRVYGR